MKSVEIFYNFMIMDANMNVFMKNPDKVTPDQAARMDAVWGDRSWRDVAYRQSQDLRASPSCRRRYRCATHAEL